jgi:hypothetical protein
MNSRNNNNSFHRAKVVTIMPKNRKDKEKSNTREKVRKSIDPTMTNATEMRNTVKREVKLNCKTNDKNKLESDIKRKLGANYNQKLLKILSCFCYNITITDQRRPKVKIVGVYDEKNLKNDEFEEIVKKQNDTLIRETDYLEIVKVIVGRINKNVKTLITEVDNRTYERLVEVGKMSINWSRYSHKGSDCRQ